MRRRSHRSASGAEHSFKHFHRCAAYTGREFLARPCDFRFNLAGTAHLDPLRHAQRLRRAEFSMLNKISSERSCSRTGRRILIELPGHHAARVGEMTAAQSETIREGA